MAGTEGMILRLNVSSRRSVLLLYGYILASYL